MAAASSAPVDPVASSRTEPSGSVTRMVLAASFTAFSDRGRGPHPGHRSGFQSLVVYHYMRRLAVRRRPAVDPSTVALGAAAGFAAGALLGFVLGEMAGPVYRAPRPNAVRGDRAVSQRVQTAQRALDDDLLLHDAHLEVVPAGRGRLELHGWVPDRPARARAGRLAAEAVPDRTVINCVLVHGEDDVDTEGDDDADSDAGPDALPA